MTTQPEQPWMSGYDDLPPWTTFLANPHADRHLGFNDDEGRFYRINATASGTRGLLL
jgi:hypothetical protein